MEQQQSTKIKFYVKRSFGEKLNASFDFIKQNWKPLLKFSTYLVLPLCLLQAVSLNKFMGIYTGIMENVEAGAADWEMFTASFIANYLLVILLAIVGGMLMTSTIYGLIRIYNERENGLQELTFQELKPYLFRNMKRYLITVVVGFLLIIVYSVLIVLLAMATPYTLILTIPALFVLAVPLAMLVPVYLFEDIGIGQAVDKTFRLGMATWGGIFGVSFVMGFISNILSGVLMLPWYVVTMVKYFFSISDVATDLGNSTGFSIVQYLLGIISTYGVYIAMIFLFVGLAYQYAHANEKVNSVSVVDEIDNFEQF